MNVTLFVCVFVCVFVCWLVGGLVGWLFGWLVGWLVCWFVGLFVCLFVCLLLYLFFVPSLPPHQLPLRNTSLATPPTCRRTPPMAAPTAATRTSATKATSLWNSRCFGPNCCFGEKSFPTKNDGGGMGLRLSRWWFQTFLIFTPYLGK